MDNTGLDTSTVAMQEYARIDLLVFQQQYETAIKDYEKMLVDFKDHALQDEIIWQLANLNLKIGKYDVAVKHLQTILKDFPDEIYGDDANFLLGKIYQEYLNNKEKAMECFQHHLVKYTGSLYTVEARKRFRELRGDGKGL
jgi:tetratricopeptide (TPR) repeat protein